MLTLTDTQPPNDEIASLADGPLQAGRLSDAVGVAATSQPDGYGDDADERAIQHLVAQMQEKPSFRGLATSDLVEKAESLYALMCRQVTDGVSDEQLIKVAALLGEAPAQLSQRLS